MIEDPLEKFDFQKPHPLIDGGILVEKFAAHPGSSVEKQYKFQLREGLQSVNKSEEEYFFLPDSSSLCKIPVSD